MTNPTLGITWQIDIELNALSSIFCLDPVEAQKLARCGHFKWISVPEIGHGWRGCRGSSGNVPLLQPRLISLTGQLQSCCVSHLFWSPPKLQSAPLTYLFLYFRHSQFPLILPKRRGEGDAIGPCPVIIILETGWQWGIGHWRGRLNVSRTQEPSLVQFTCERPESTNAERKWPTKPVYKHSFWN